MLFFKCCTTCQGDMLLEADARQAQLKCLRCGFKTDIPADTHLYEVICKEDTSPGFMAQAA